MPLQFSDRCRNAAADAIETTIGTAPTLRIRSGAIPANTAAARTGTVLATLVLPSDFLSNAAAGLKSILGTWQDAAADASGTAGYFDITGTGAIVDLQGSVTATGGGGDMKIQNTNIAVGQQITVTQFDLQLGGG